MSVLNCHIIDLPVVCDERGSLSFIQFPDSIPFDIKRIYYLYNNNTHHARGAHAHINLKQFIIAISGSFEVILDDGLEKKSFMLNDPGKALYVDSGMWRDVKNFDTHAVCLVLASEHYLEDDYIRDYQVFLKFARGKKHER